jgi:hypothetical protein
MLKFFFSEPRPAQGLNATVKSSTAISLLWDLPDRGGVDNYTVTFTPSHGGYLPIVRVVSGLSLNFTEAMPGETYNISIVCNKGTESSNPATVVETTCE